MAAEFPRDDLKEQAGKKAYDYELHFHGCSQAVFMAFKDLWGLDDDLAFKAAGPLCAGMGMGKTCGALAGGIMVLGLKKGRTRIEEGVDGLIPGLFAAQSLVRKFEREFGTTSCSEISKVDWTDLDEITKVLSDREFMAKCANVARRTAEMVAEVIAEEA